MSEKKLIKCGSTRLNTLFSLLQTAQVNEETPDATDTATAALDDDTSTVVDLQTSKASAANFRSIVGRKRRRSAVSSPDMWTQRQNVQQKIATSMDQPAKAAQSEDAAEYFGKLVAAQMHLIPKAEIIACQTTILKTPENYVDSTE